MTDSLLVTLLQNRDFSLFIKIAVFLVMFSMGLRLTRPALEEIRTYPGALARSLFGVIVLMPVAIFAIGPLLKAVGVSAAVGTGIALLAASPGAPMTTKRTSKAGGDFEFSAALQLLCGISAILVTPGFLWLYAQLFPKTREAVQFWVIAKQVLVVQLLPLGIGLAIRLLWSELAEEVVPRLMTIVNVVFLVLILVAVIVSLPVILESGIVSILAITLVAAIALIIGHLLGGPELSFQSASAVACVARNIGLALMVATINNKLLLVLPTIVGYMIIGSIVAIPYSVWMKKRIAQQAANLESASAVSPAS